MPALTLTFANKLAEVRRRLGASQSEIEKVTGIRFTQISRHENNIYPKMTLRTAYLYALALGVSVEDIFPPEDIPADLKAWIDEGRPGLINGTEESDEVE